MSTTVGLDVGGAHLKVAMIKDGRLVTARQEVCPLWQGADKLDTALSAIADITSSADRIAFTMTAELSDLFDNRATGVRWIIDRLVREYPNHSPLVWTAQGEFTDTLTAKDRPGDVASMNYLATAHLAASTLKNALLIDMGTTTTDIIPIIDGSPQNVGQTDADRLASGELVYTGLSRTAVMAVVDAVPFRGAWVPICREYFATMADVQRVLEALPAGVDDQQTADGRGKSLQESISRLARMIGRDGADGSPDDWRSMARYVARAQFGPINDAVGLVVSRHPKLISSPIVTTGCAIASLEHWAKGQGLRPLAYQTLFNDPKPDPHHINTCATAAAIAALV